MEQAAKAGEYDYNGFTEAIRRSPMNDADKKIAQEKTLTCLLVVNVKKKFELIVYNHNGQSITSCPPVRGDVSLLDDVEQTREVLLHRMFPLTQNFSCLLVLQRSDRRNTTVENDKSYITAGRTHSVCTPRTVKIPSDGMSAFDAHLKAEAEVLSLSN